VELLHLRCAGLDVAKDEVVACVRVPDGQGGRGQEVRTFPTLTSGLEALAGWLAAEGVTQVVMEATGQSWKPVWYVLEERASGCCWSTPARSRSSRAARPMSVTRPGLLSCWSVGCWGAASWRRPRSGSCGISPATARG
jgi:transposase